MGRGVVQKVVHEDVSLLRPCARLCLRVLGPRPVSLATAATFVTLWCLVPYSSLLCHIE